MELEALQNTATELASLSLRRDDPSMASHLLRVKGVIERFAKAFSGSWWGYHSRVYYADFISPSPGDSFNMEWGLTRRNRDTGWREYRADEVIRLIEAQAGNPDLDAFLQESSKVGKRFEELHGFIVSRLTYAVAERPGDKFLEDLLSKATRIRIMDAGDVVSALSPKGKAMSRDAQALTAGLQAPPHIQVSAKVSAIEVVYDACEELAKVTNTAVTHLRYEAKQVEQIARIGTRVFIGHGRATDWRDLKDFLQDRMHLPWDEFNRVPVAGVTNIVRLGQMLDGAAIAFLVMTAEDEQADGSVRARENVVHEAGLFQGRLGFDRAIVLLEEGCQEFSNINGLGQIRFPKKNIKAVFEDIRAVLEREGLAQAT